MSVPKMFVVKMVEVETTFNAIQEPVTTRRTIRVFINAKDMDDAVRIFKQYRDFNEFESVTFSEVYTQFIDKEIPHI